MIKFIKSGVEPDYFHEEKRNYIPLFPHLLRHNSWRHKHCIGHLHRTCSYHVNERSIDKPIHDHCSVHIHRQQNQHSGAGHAGSDVLSDGPGDGGRSGPNHSAAGGRPAAH